MTIFLVCYILISFITLLKMLIEKHELARNIFDEYLLHTRVHL